MLTISAAIRAQVASTGSVRGSVSDPSGGVLSGATVTLVEVHTGALQETKTDAAGSYNFPIVPVGSYQLQITMVGFKSFTEAGISVQAAERRNFAVTFTVAATWEKMKGTAEVPTVDTVTASEGNTVKGKKLTELR